MVKRMGGFRHKTRYKLQIRPAERGRIRITARLAQFNEGDSVALVIDPSEQKGIFFPRHHGKTGVIVGKRGNCYLVRFNDKNKAKTAIAGAIHLKKVASAIVEPVTTVKAPKASTVHKAAKAAKAVKV